MQRWPRPSESTWRGWDYLLIAMMVMAMIASLKAVGVVMSIGLLILGMISAVTGLLLSYWVNLPSGRAIVMVLSAVFVAAFLKTAYSCKSDRFFPPHPTPFMLRVY